MNNEHFSILSSGTERWNRWRDERPEVRPNLEGADLRSLTLRDANLSDCNLQRVKANGDYKSLGANLVGADLSGADLRGARLRAAVLRHARLDRADLSEANLSHADLYHVSLRHASMQRVDLWGAYITESDLHGADLTEARLRHTLLVQSDLSNARLSGSVVYGGSVWDLRLDGASQDNLVITPDAGRQRWRGSAADGALEAPTITVDNLEVAQFLYLILNNAQLRTAIDTITTKAVLILGRFTTERKAILDGLRTELRNHDLLPIMFDFERPSQRSFSETVSLLAQMSRFIIVDITDARATPQELQRIVPSNPSVPVAPIAAAGAERFGMFEDFAAYPWVLDVFEYADLDGLVTALPNEIIAPCLAKVP